jgi:hypothetical protein
MTTDESNPAGRAAPPDGSGGPTTGPIGEVRDRERARLAGTVRAVTLRPPSTAPAFEVILDDGTGALRVVWMGQRDIPGISPGRGLLVEGRVSRDTHGPTMRDPRYELLPGGPA